LLLQTNRPRPPTKPLILPAIFKQQNMFKRNTAHEGGQKETTRLEAFSDGVFSIAITLLVLEVIQFVHLKEGESVFHSITSHWQPFLAFFIGFSTIMVCWVNHHYAFNFIHKVDPAFLWVNGFLLFMVTLTPLPTAILAEALRTDGNLALALFGFNFIMIGVAAYGICAYAYNHSLIDQQSRELFNAMRLGYAYSIGYTIIAFGVCFVSIPIAVILYLVLFSTFAFPQTVARRILKMKQRKKKKQVSAPGPEEVVKDEPV
jgi:uncharacterized membrane protein